DPGGAGHDLQRQRLAPEAVEGVGYPELGLLPALDRRPPLEPYRYQVGRELLLLDRRGGAEVGQPLPGGPPRRPRPRRPGPAPRPRPGGLERPARLLELRRGLAGPADLHPAPVVHVAEAGAVDVGEDAQREGFLLALFRLIVQQPAEVDVAEVLLDVVQ